VYIGEVTNVESRVSFASSRSMGAGGVPSPFDVHVHTLAEVEVAVYAENAQGDIRLTNKARCWYVGTPMPVSGTQVWLYSFFF
jgi:hypothetical protein